MTSKMDIAALQALCAISDQAGVSRAAAFLAVSQSAVSHRIRRLEETLGCALLDRRAGHPLFTPEGDKLLGFARRILSIHDEAIDSLSTEPLSGRVRLGVTEDATSGSLSRVLGHFTRLQPAVTVQIGVAQSRTICERLDRGELDVGVLQIFARDRRPDDILLQKDVLLWVKSPDLSVGQERPVPLLTFDQNCYYRSWALQADPMPDRGFDVTMECASLAGMIAAVRAGLGITLLSGRHVEPDMEIIEAGFSSPPDVAYVVRTGRKTRSAAVAGLVRAISDDADWNQPLSKAAQA